MIGEQDQTEGMPSLEARRADQAEDRADASPALSMVDRRPPPGGRREADSRAAGVPERVLQEIYPKLVRAARTVLPASEAHDLVHDALVEILVRYPNFSGLRNPSAYARVVLFRRLFNSRARGLKEAKVSEDLLARLEREPSDRDLASIVDRVTITEALKTLGRRQRACVYLRYVVELDDAEIGRFLGCSRTTVRSQVARGLHNLRSKFPEMRWQDGRGSDR